jgi:hypothetical protein
MPNKVKPKLQGMILYMKLESGGGGDILNGRVEVVVEQGESLQRDSYGVYLYLNAMRESGGGGLTGRERTWCLYCLDDGTPSGHS